MSIKQSLVADVKNGAVLLKEVKPPSSRRTLNLSHDVLTLFKVHKARQDAERMNLGEAWTDSDLVFTTSTGTPILSAKRAEKPQAAL